MNWAEVVNGSEQNNTKISAMKKEMMKFIEDAKAITNGIRKSGGGERIVKWKHMFDPMAINPMLPLFRTLEGNNHCIFAIDTDVEIETKYIEDMKTLDDIRKLKLRAAMTFWEKWSRDNPEYEFFDYVSGKGMYRVQKTPPMSKTEFYDILFGNKKKRMLKSNDGFRLEGNRIVNYITIDEIKYKIIIDTSLYTKGQHLFRVPYSPYMKFGYKTFYCVPVVKDEFGNFFIEETIKRTEFSNLVVETIDVPFIDYQSKLPSIRVTKGNEISKYSINLRRNIIEKQKVYYKFSIPEPEDELNELQQRKIERMIKIVSDPEKTPPCILNAWKRKDEHWMKVVLLRYLASLRYKNSFPNVRFSWNDLALFFRFAVNDEEDNELRNRDRLFTNIYTFLRNPENPDKPPSCAIMQDKMSNFYCCDILEDAVKCNRLYCLYPNSISVSLKSDKTSEIETDVQSVFKTINDLSSQIIMSKNNLEVIKTTRAGVTTSLIHASVFHNKRMLAVVPTTAIAKKVFNKALKIAYEMYGQKIDGAVLSSNIKSCLKLRFTVEDLRKKKEENPNWGESSDIEWEKLPFHSKPSCTVVKDGIVRECEYFHYIYEFPHLRDNGIPYAVTESRLKKDDEGNVVEGYCAYQTVMQMLSNYDVIFITYDKLSAMLLNTEAEAREFIEMLILEFDIIFFDEISTLVQSSPLSITMFEQVEKLDEDGNKFTDIYYEDFCNQLFIELSRLEKPPDIFNGSSFETYTSRTFEELKLITNKFIERFDRFIREKRFSGDFDEVTCWKVENFLLEDKDINLEEFRNKFFAFYSLLSNYTKRTNEKLSSLLQMIILLQSDTWWLQSVPTKNDIEKKLNASFVTSPKITKMTGFVQRLNEAKKKIIFTDATMPLVNLEKVFNIELEKFIVGDPRNTCDKQIIIPYNRTYSVIDLFRLNWDGKRSKINDIQQELIDMINEVCRVHGTENVLVVLPNSHSSLFMLNKFKKSGLVPKDLKYTWYRSSMTIGVERNERVMITVCQPSPPKYSSLWLANYYIEQGLFEDYDEELAISANALSRELEKMNEHQAFYQTIGRVKDPEAKKRSVVYTFGMSYHRVKEILGYGDKDVPYPHVVDTRFIPEIKNYLTKIGYVWSKFGLIIDRNFIKIYNYIKRYGTISANHMIKNLKVPKDIIKEMIKNSNFMKYMGLELLINRDTNELFFVYR